MKIILGLNAFHGDSSACIVKDGVVLAAVEEERFKRIKHWAGFPNESIKYCLRAAGIDISDVTDIAINQNPKAQLLEKLKFVLSHRLKVAFLINRLSNFAMRVTLPSELNHFVTDVKFKGRVHYIEHHEAHLASAYYTCPYPSSSILSVDGFGDFSSTAWAKAHDGEIQIVKRVYFPHSLGVFYQAVTQHLGFANYGDEYKVMGLAPYGRDTYRKQMECLVQLREEGSFTLNLSYFCHHRGKFDYAWKGGTPRVGTLFSDEIKNLLGPPRNQNDVITQHHYDIANSCQAMYERALFHILEEVYRNQRSDSVALAGGCAMNSVANGKITSNTSFKRVYVPAAPGDAGGAVGAALAVWYSAAKSVASKGTSSLSHAYLGPSYSSEQLRDCLEVAKLQLESLNVRVNHIEDTDELCRLTALDIYDGKVVGWFQGRLEWGPRALGNRSILADPRRADMKSILNLKIKRRESFRPFAPSILREYVEDWFEKDDDVPFMDKVFNIREDKRSLIPAVTHVDGTGRLQTVERSANPIYYQLIEEFKVLSGVPIILNTSFNENEPVVCSPQEALDCFLRTRMDVLVMGNWILRRQ